MPRTCVYTIVSNNYLHYARTLMASVKRHAPGIDTFVAICDSSLPSPDPRNAFESIDIRTIGLPDHDRFIFQYTILELNTAIKPWVAASLFARGYERVVYFDPDIEVHAPLDDLFARLDAANIVVTPHLTGWLDDGRHPAEIHILQSGSYNLGFIAMRRGQVTDRFLEWWQRKLTRDCVVDIPRGLFTDQRWIDMVPGMYEGVHIERSPGWNVAYWNLNHRHVSRDGDRIVVDGEPLLFFHYSGYTPGAKTLSKHQNRYTLDNIEPAVRELVERYGNALRANGFEEARAAAYGFGRFADGSAIPDFARKVYRETIDWNAAHPDLYSEEGQRYIFALLNSPRPEVAAQAPWLSRIAEHLWSTRPDLRTAFPDVTGVHGRAYAAWFAENAITQAGFTAPFVDPVRRALRGESETGSGKRSGSSSSRVATDTAAGIGSGAASSPTASSLGRRVFDSAYRGAWRLRTVVRPFTSQAFRHRVQHFLLRRAYYDPSYRTPPLARPLAPATAVHRPSRALDKRRGFGVNVIGYLSAESGIGESARSMVRALRAADVPVSIVDFRVGNVSRMNERLETALAQGQRYAVNLLHVNADQMGVLRDALGPRALDGFHNVGYWAWELPEFPPEWDGAFDLVDEVWSPSTFAQQAIAARATVPVLRVPHAVDPASSTQADRSAFGFSPGETVFFTMCDALSVPERKNPEGAVDAFLRAFPRGDEPVRLVVKVSNIERQPMLDRSLAQAHARDARITVMRGYLEREALSELLASIDVFLSLHRSEGFGLGLAEAMARGTLVMATDWSGNADFVNAANAVPVAARIVALERDHGPYRRGNHWADPDLDDAAAKMAAIASGAIDRVPLVQAARLTVSHQLSPAAVGALARGRIEIVLARHGIAVPQRS